MAMVIEAIQVARIEIALCLRRRGGADLGFLDFAPSRSISTTDSGMGRFFRSIGTPARGRQGMLKEYRVTRQMPACVTLRALPSVN